MLEDDKLTIKILNKLSLRIEIRNIFFCLILEKCDSFGTQPKRNTMLKIMDSQRKLATARNHAFQKSSGGGCNEVKSCMISQFENKDTQEVWSDSQADKMNKCLCWARVLIRYVDGHIGKKYRTDEFSLPGHLKGLSRE